MRNHLDELDRMIHRKPNRRRHMIRSLWDMTLLFGAILSAFNKQTEACVILSAMYAKTGAWK